MLIVSSWGQGTAKWSHFKEYIIFKGQKMAGCEEHPQEEVFCELSLLLHFQSPALISLVSFQRHPIFPSISLLHSMTYYVVHVRLKCRVGISCWPFHSLTHSMIGQRWACDLHLAMRNYGTLGLLFVKIIRNKGSVGGFWTERSNFWDWRRSSNSGRALTFYMWCSRCNAKYYTPQIK